MYPFMVFDLSHDADDAAVQSRYLELLARFPQEISPDMHRLVQTAYQRLKDPEARALARLFYKEEPLYRDEEVAPDEKAGNGDGSRRLLGDLRIWAEQLPRDRMSTDELRDFIRALD